MLKRSLLAVALFALHLVFVPGAQASQGLRLKDITPFLENYLRLPPAERDLFRMHYCLIRSDRPVAEATARFVIGGETRSIATDARGCWRRLPTVEELRANPPVSLGRPIDPNNDIDLLLTLNGAPQESYALAPLIAALTQAGRGARKQAGVIGFAVPRFETIYFEYDGRAPTGAVAVMADSRRVTLPFADGVISFTPGDPLFAGAQRLELIRAPSVVFFGPKPE